MLRIRYTRVGKKDQPHYRVVVAEHSRPVQGKFVEILGHYNPFTKKAVLDKEKIELWLKKGAKPSNSVARLLKKEGFKHKSIVIVEFKKKPKAKKGADNKPQTNAENNPQINAEKSNVNEVKDEAPKEQAKEEVEAEEPKQEAKIEKPKQVIKKEEKSETPKTEDK